MDSEGKGGSLAEVSERKREKWGERGEKKLKRNKNKKKGGGKRERLEGSEERSKNEEIKDKMYDVEFIISYILAIISLCSFFNKCLTISLSMLIKRGMKDDQYR